MDGLTQDLRYAARRLLQSRGFTAVAILTLALGVGANTAIFQLLDAVRLRSLPVEAPGQLAEIRIANMRGARGDFSIWHAGVNSQVERQLVGTIARSTLAFGADNQLKLESEREAARKSD